MHSSFNAQEFICKNAFRNCEEIGCECSVIEECEESWDDEISSKESYEEIDWTDDNKPQNASLSLWEEILQESENQKRKFEEWKTKQREPTIEDTKCENIEYLNREIFPTLLEGMTKMLREARKFNAIENIKCRFNGLDYLAEYLWNKNLFHHPERQFNWVGVFDIPQFRSWLRVNPRKIYPKSWLWSEQEAALIIQRNVRGWLVRKREDVQELRQFWKAFAAEQADCASSLASVNLDEFKELLIEASKASIDLCKIIPKE